MVPISEYKTLDIKLDKVNSYIPPIVVNEADNNGRRLKFTPTYEGQPVTGITSARMYYDPRPRDASSIGDYVDGTKDGDGWVFIIPPNTFTADAQGIASVSFTDADGETYTRSMPIDVESGGTKIDSQGTRIDRLISTLEQMVNDFTMTADAETGPAGSQASVKVTRLSNGSYKLDFTIPTGEKGPKGDPGDLTTVAHDATLTGDGTSGSPLGIISGTAINEKILTNVTVDFNDYIEPGFYGCNSVSLLNAPDLGETTRFSFLVLNCGYTGDNRKTCCIQVLFNREYNKTEIYMRTLQYAQTWGNWVKFITDSTYSTLASRVEALESQVAALQVADKTN